MLSATRLAFKRSLATPALARRAYATETSNSVPSDREQRGQAGSRRPVGHATVEELHSQTAAEILAERDGGKNGTMRHFTVNFG